jgi:4-amino-4-deoxy-L-arabinose transferase-like glycosyltransferase
MTNRLIGDYGVETDFYVAYVPQAKEFLNGNLIIDSYRGPLYQIILAIFGFIFKLDFFTAGKFLNVLSASISLYFISKIVGSIFNREAAFFTSLLLAVNLNFLRYSYTPGTDMLFLVFYSSALFWILKSEELNNKNLFISGILTSMAYLTRYTGISLIIFAFFVFILQTVKKYKTTNSINLNLYLKPLLFFLTPLIFSISVWGLFCYKYTGYYFYNLNYQNTALTFYKPAEITKDEWIFKHQNTFNSLSDVVFRDFSVFSKKILLNFSTYFIKDITRLFPKYFGLIFAIGLLFFVLKFKSQKTNEKYFFISGVIFYFQLLLIFYSERFSIPLLPLYCFIIIKFFSYDFFQKFNFNFSKIRLFGVILLSLILLNLYSSFVITKNELNAGPIEILDIKEWVNNNYKEDLSKKTIMARKPHIAYYLNMKFEVTPYVENYSEFLNALKTTDADYYFVSEKEAGSFDNENLRQILLNFNNSPEELEIITKTVNPVSILYKVKK